MGRTLPESAVEGPAEGLAEAAARDRADAARQGDDEMTFAPGVVVVSCYRGPWRETFWDHPEHEFVDSLVGAGYDYGSAEAIGERVCRDEALVGDPEALRAEVERIMAASPVRR